MDLGSVAPAAGAEWIGTVPHEDLVRGIRPQLPSDDPFYEPPTGYQHATPGTVLRSRDVELAFMGLIPQKFTATQLLYRTTDRHGNADAAATTVIVPAERAPRGRHPSPLLPMRDRRRHLAMLSVVCPAAIRAGDRRGRAVRVSARRGRARRGLGGIGTGPRGPPGMWGAPYEPGYHVLDGLRAALSSKRLGLSPDAPIGLWGYSGGGLASAWAAEMSGSYAPELNIVGAVLGSPVGDLGETFRRLNGTVMSGLPALVVAALGDIYPDLNRVIQEHATEEGKALLLRLHDMTTAEAVIRMAKKDMDDMVDVPLEQILDTPEVQHVFADIKLGVAVPTPPVLIVQAVHDQLISVENIDELADTYQSGGASVTYHRDMFSEHLLMHPMSAPMTLRWLTDRFNGKPLSEHMVRTKWPTLLNPMTYVGMARLAKIVAKVVTGQTVERSPL